VRSRSYFWIKLLSAIVAFSLRHVVFALMLSIGLASRPRDLVPERSKLRAYLRSLVAIELAVPLLALAIVEIFQLPRLASILILLMAVCPGAPFIPMAAKLKGEAYSLFGLHMVLLLSVLSIVTLPAWIWVMNWLHPFGFEIPPLRIVDLVLRTVIVPLALGTALRHFVPRAAGVLARVVHYVFLAALAVVIVFALYMGAPVFLTMKPKTALAVLALFVGSELIGYIAGSPDPEQRRVTTVAAVLGNPSLALAVVGASYPGFKAAAVVAAFVLFRRLALTPVDLWLRRKARRSSATLPPRAAPA